MDEAASDEAWHSETDSENDSAKRKSVSYESTSSESESEEVCSGVLPEVLSRDTTITRKSTTSNITSKS